MKTIIATLQLFAVAASAATMSLKWEPNLDDGLTAGYRIQRGTISGNYTFIRDVGTETFMRMTDITSGTHYYLTVIAYNAAGIESAPSVEIEAIGGAPIAPVGLCAIGPTPSPTPTPTPTPPPLPTPKPVATLQNVSTRADVGTGAYVTIAGFQVGPMGFPAKKMIVRGLGPSLKKLLPGVITLKDPTLQIWDATGKVIATNDNWITNKKAIEATGLAPGDGLEAAIVMNFAPGAYTAILAGKNNGIGVGLVEVYPVP